MSLDSQPIYLFTPRDALVDDTTFNFLCYSEEGKNIRSHRHRERNASGHKKGQKGGYLIIKAMANVIKWSEMERIIENRKKID